MYIYIFFFLIYNIGLCWRTIKLTYNYDSNRKKKKNVTGAKGLVIHTLYKLTNKIDYINITQRV